MKMKKLSTLKDPKNDPLSIHLRKHFCCTFSHVFNIFNVPNDLHPFPFGNTLPSMIGLKLWMDFTPDPGTFQSLLMHYNNGKVNETVSKETTQFSASLFFSRFHSLNM